MPRVKRGVNAKKKRKKILELAKGYYGSKHSCYRIAKEQVTKSLTYAYRDRRNKKRDFRKLWIIRINAAARQNGLSYNKFMNGLRLADIEVDRKILSELALNDPQAFSQLAETAKEQLAAS